MVEVIKRGVPYEDRTLEAECRYCLSLLRFKGSEVVEGVSIKYVVCPICDYWVDAGDAKNVPI